MYTHVRAARRICVRAARHAPRAVISEIPKVIIYYVNYFFNVIIETKDVPYLTSIWGPQIILSLIIITNLIRINEK